MPTRRPLQVVVADPQGIDTVQLAHILSAAYESTVVIGDGVTVPLNTVVIDRDAPTGNGDQ